MSLVILYLYFVGAMMMFSIYVNVRGLVHETIVQCTLYMVFWPISFILLSVLLRKEHRKKQHP